MAIQYLVRGVSASATARALGVHERTVRRWQHDELFSREVRRAVQELLAARSGVRR